MGNYSWNLYDAAPDLGTWEHPTTAVEYDIILQNNYVAHAYDPVGGTAYFIAGPYVGGALEGIEKID